MQENIGWAKLITMLKEKRTESGSPKMLNVGYASKKKNLLHSLNIAIDAGN